MRSLPSLFRYQCKPFDIERGMIVCITVGVSDHELGGERMVGVIFWRRSYTLRYRSRSSVGGGECKGDMKWRVW